MSRINRGSNVGVVVLLASALGCRIDGSIGRDGADSTGSVTEPSSSGPQTTGSATGADEDTGFGTGGGGGTVNETSAATDTSASTGGVPAACIVTPDDNACMGCRKDHCCTAYETCLEHEVCLCWWGCTVEGHSSKACAEQCSSDGAIYEELATCSQRMCIDCPG